MAFLKGKNKKVLRSLRENMEAASEEENFERAAKLRDAVQPFLRKFQPSLTPNISR
jgi:excinuclease UvrABC nuclease subunit